MENTETEPENECIKTLVDLVNICDTIGENVNDFNVLNQTQFYNSLYLHFF